MVRCLADGLLNVEVATGGGDHDYLKPSNLGGAQLSGLGSKTAF